MQQKSPEICCIPYAFELHQSTSRALLSLTPIESYIQKR